MITSIILKISLILLCMSVLNIGRHIFKIIKLLREDDVANTYKLTTMELVMLGLSISYVLTTIFTIPL